MFVKEAGRPGGWGGGEQSESNIGTVETVKGASQTKTVKSFGIFLFFLNQEMQLINVQAAGLLRWGPCPVGGGGGPGSPILLTLIATQLNPCGVKRLTREASAAV